MTVGSFILDKQSRMFEADTRDQEYRPNCHRGTNPRIAIHISNGRSGGSNCSDLSFAITSITVTWRAQPVRRHTPALQLQCLQSRARRVLLEWSEDWAVGKVAFNVVVETRWRNNEGQARAVPKNARERKIFGWLKRLG
eukprot:m.398540 g.398540  ORF g.398540 m.398540 type:complete len:139 (+) comp16776_c1_seq2:3372-3788(+)